MKRQEKVCVLSKQLSKFYRIHRNALRSLIVQNLDIHDAHSVNSWIFRLQAKGFLETDLTSLTPTGKPSSKTFYLVNKQKCEDATQ